MVASRPRSSGLTDSASGRPSDAAAWRMVAALAFLGSLALYARCAAPGLLWADSGEMQIAALTGGIPHPTGYPSFVMLGRLFALLPFPDHAYRITFMTGCFGALTLALFTCVMRELGVRPLHALAGAMLCGASFTFWSANLRTEVYTVATTFFLIALWRALVSFRTGRARDRLTSALFLGLTLTGHLSFAFPVALLGLTLAWRSWQAGGSRLASLLSLLGVFLLGLTPYLYIVWMDGRNPPYDYLRLVDQVWFNGGAARPPWFDRPWGRLQWMLTGRDNMPPVPLKINAVASARNFLDSSAMLALFEIGPIGTLLALSGLTRLWRDARGKAALLAGVTVLSLAFSAIAGYGALIPIFIIPGTLAASLLAAYGLAAVLEALARRVRMPSVAAAAVALIAPALIQLPAHALRLRSVEHPIGRPSWRYVDEGGERIATLFPRRNHFTEPERFSRRLAEILPAHALVIAAHGERSALYYLRDVLGLRGDLTFHPDAAPGVLVAVRQWADRHALERDPIVFISPSKVLASHFASRDSIHVSGDHWMVVVRPPLEALPAR